MLRNLNELNRASIMRLVLPRLCMKKPDDGIVWSISYNHPFFIRYYIPYHTDKSGSFSSIQVNRSMFNRFDLDRRDLMEAAFYNIESIYQISNLTELISQLTGEQAVKDECPMVVVNNSRDYLFGAAAAVCNSVIDCLHDRLGDIYILLPSSIHECICLPMIDKGNLSEFTNMVREINRKTIAPSERLSNKAYTVTGYDFNEIDVK